MMQKYFFWCLVLSVALSIEGYKRGFKNRKRFYTDKHLNFYKMVTQVQSISDFERIFLKGRSLEKPINTQQFVMADMSSSDQTSVNSSSNSNKNQKKQPSCIPRGQLYSLPFDEPGYTIIPRCLHNVTRCGGCCSNPKHVCTPHKVTPKLISVYKFDPYDPIQTAKKVDIPYDQHDTCQCQCRKSDAKRCNSFERFDSLDCNCHCNVTETNTVVSCPPFRQWSPTVCNCVCSIQICSGDLVLNQVTCTCQTKRGK